MYLTSLTHSPPHYLHHWWAAPWQAPGGHGVNCGIKGQLYPDEAQHNKVPGEGVEIKPIRSCQSPWRVTGGWINTWIFGGGGGDDGDNGQEWWEGNDQIVAEMMKTVVMFQQSRRLFLYKLFSGSPLRKHHYWTGIHFSFSNLRWFVPDCFLACWPWRTTGSKSEKRVGWSWVCQLWRREFAVVWCRAPETHDASRWRGHASNYLNVWSGENCVNACINVFCYVPEAYVVSFSILSAHGGNAFEICWQSATVRKYATKT